jgi:uncharacterized membrane protein YphA (DoxX/SURF4 family)
MGVFMNVVTWVAQGVLALAFLAAGGMKLFSPREKLVAAGKAMAWTEDFSSGSIKAIGGVEILGAVGVILPAVLRIIPTLTPFAALSLAVVMAGAVVVHIRRREAAALGGPVLLCLIAIFVAVMRLGPLAS